MDRFDHRFRERIHTICICGTIAEVKKWHYVQIRREQLITGLHDMYAREFAVQCLFAAIVSLVAPLQFSLCQQMHYVIQRILTQTLLFALHCWAHFGLDIYTPAHTLPFVLSFFHCALLFVAFQRIRIEQAVEEAMEAQQIHCGIDAKKLGRGGPAIVGSAFRDLATTLTTPMTVSASAAPISPKIGTKTTVATVTLRSQSPTKKGK